MFRLLQRLGNKSFLFKSNVRKLQPFGDHPFYSIRKVKKQGDADKKTNPNKEDFEVEDVPIEEMKGHMKEAKKQEREDQFEIHTMVNYHKASFS